MSATSHAAERFARNCCPRTVNNRKLRRAAARLARRNARKAVRAGRDN